MRGVCYNQTRFHGGYSSMVERRSVAPDGVGSSPTTHPNRPFSFNRLAYAAGSIKGPNLLHGPGKHFQNHQIIRGSQILRDALRIHVQRCADVCVPQKFLLYLHVSLEIAQHRVLALLRSVKTLEGTDKDSVEHLLQNGG